MDPKGIIKKLLLNKVEGSTLKTTDSTENSSTEEFERCVICGAKTDVKKSTHIEFRKCYEIGCGQLCTNCYDELHK